MKELAVSQSTHTFLLSLVRSYFLSLFPVSFFSHSDVTKWITRTGGTATTYIFASSVFYHILFYIYIRGYKEFSLVSIWLIRGYDALLTRLLVFLSGIKFCSITHITCLNEFIFDFISHAILIRLFVFLSSIKFLKNYLFES